MEQPCGTSKVITAAAPAQRSSNTDKKLDRFTTNNSGTSTKCKSMAAYDQPLRTSRPSQPTIGRVSNIPRLTSYNDRSLI